MLTDEIKTTDLSGRLKYRTKGDTTIVEDVVPPIFILPFVMNEQGRNIQYLYLHEYKNIYGDTKTTVTDVSSYNFDSNSDVVSAFVSKFFSIPAQRLDINRIFYLGECSVDISLFKSSVECYAVNITGLIQDNEVKIKLESDDSFLVRCQYYDMMKGHYMDVMTMSTTFQLMSNFMH